MVAISKERPDLIQVIYRVLSDKLLDPDKKAKEIALGQTTGAWTRDDKAGQAKLAKHRGEVLGIDERTHAPGRPYEYYMTVGFPPANTEGDIPSLLTMVFGQPSMDGKIRLESIRFPEDYLKGKGPRFGISGLREKVGEPTKALAMATLKPSIGPSPKEIGEMFYELASGGMHLVKDDEILPDLPLCPTEKRLAACLEAAERARGQTGHRTLYAVNLTGAVIGLVAKAKRLAKEGAPCFLLNVLCYGFGVLEELREVGVPLIAHPSLAGAMSGGQETGISYSVLLGTLMRLGGADIVLFPFSEAAGMKEALTWTMGPLRKAFPAPSGEIHPGMVPKILSDYGNDVIVNAGGGVHEHPQGSQTGAKAFRQAIAWVTQRGNFGGFSEREFPELTEALRHWGKT
jgi:2,3-diketo-5-methylthiopentyl-1-phosphate enolase